MLFRKRIEQLESLFKSFSNALESLEAEIDILGRRLDKLEKKSNRLK